MNEQVTAFGAAFAAPAQTAAVLRARASAAGLDATPAEGLDLLTAVVAAQAVVTALGVTSLAHVRGSDGVAALAAVYCRAGGRADRPVPQSSRDCEGRLADLSERVTPVPATQLPQEALAAVARAADWARSHGAGSGVLIAAAEDLATGWGHPALAAVSDALLTLAHDH